MPLAEFLTVFVTILAIELLILGAMTIFKDLVTYSIDGDEEIPGTGIHPRKVYLHLEGRS